jgi:hypothetical protein
VTGPVILKSLSALIKEGGFGADAVIIDGFDFSKSDRERMSAVREGAKSLGVSFWYSSNDAGALAPYMDLLDIVIQLEPKSDHIEMSALKDRDAADLEHLAVKLDPKTLLIQ